MSVRNLLVLFATCLVLAGCNSAEEKAQGHYERGLELLADGDEARARLEFRNALRQLDTMIEPRLELARLNRADGSTGLAMRDYLRVAEQDPTNLEAVTALGELSFETRDWEVFERYAEAAVALAPDTPAVQAIKIAKEYRVAVLDEDDAVPAGLMAEAKALQSDIPANDMLRQILIDGYLRDSRFADALVQIEDAIAASPDQMALYDLKLQVLAETRDAQALETELRRMIVRFPDEVSVQARLHQFLLADGRIDEAETLLRDRVAAATPDDASPMVDLVHFLLQYRTSDTAMQALEDAIEKSPGAVKLQALHAALLFENGAHDQAIGLMQEIINTSSSAELSQVTEEQITEAQAPEDLEALKMTLARMLSESGKDKEARRIVSELLATNPQRVDALKMQARWMIAEDDTDGAINALRVALASSDRDVETMTIMAEAYSRAGKRDLMLDFLSQATAASNNAPEQALRYATALWTDDKLSQAETVLSKALSTQPDHVEILSTLGQINLGLGNLVRVRTIAETLEDIGTPPARLSAKELKLALLFREGGTDRAIAYLEGLATREDAGKETQVALVRTHMQVGEYENALSLLEDLIAKHPSDPALIYYRGIAEGAVGQYAAATKTFRDLTAENPSFILGWVQLARLASIENNTDGVLRTLNEGIAANATSKDLLWAKASLLETRGDIDAAIEVYEELYDLDSASLVIANNLASLLATYRDDDTALARARLISRRLNGTEIPALQDTYGWILFRSGQTEEALDYLEPAAEGLPNDPSVQFHLGEVYYALGRQQEAFAQMRKAEENIGQVRHVGLREEILSRVAELEKTVTEPVLQTD